VIAVANLRIEKGHDTLLAAATRVLAERPDIEFVLVGDGVERARLERQAADRGLSRAVQFLGERGDVADLLSSSDLFVLPSRSEACPNSVLEAMAAGLPIIATRVGGIPELISHGTDGVLVDADRPDVLAEAILDVARRPDAARTMGCAARSRAVRDFSFERMVANFEDLYLSQLTHSVRRDVELAAE
jgi:glycosyltransferase involved in cell wall biosynthesis